MAATNPQRRPNLTTARPSKTYVPLPVHQFQPEKTTTQSKNGRDQPKSSRPDADTGWKQCKTKGASRLSNIRNSEQPEIGQSTLPRKGSCLSRLLGSSKPKLTANIVHSHAKNPAAGTGFKTLLSDKLGQEPGSNLQEESERLAIPDFL